MSIKEIYSLFKKYPVITTDTRNCTSNSIFIALKGTHFNGNQYARKAIQEGCAYAIVDEPEYADNKKILLSEMNGLETLQALARYHRRQFTIPVLAITGTNGKTTTKELIANVLSKGHTVLYTEGNLNNHIGVPLTLLRMSGEHTIAVIEMGANHPGEIAELCAIAEPTYGLVTNVGKAHLEGFGSLEGVIRTKGELFEYLQDHEGTIFLQGENPYLKPLVSGLEAIRYGVGEDNIVVGSIVSSSPFLTYQWKVRGGKYVYTVDTKLVGAYNLENVLAATVVGRHFGINPAQINKAISEYIPTNNRSQLKKTAANTLIIDAYNANPESMMLALDNFRKMEMSGKTLILGDMRELGVNSDEEHEYIARLADRTGAEVFLIGENFYRTNAGSEKFEDTESFKQWLQTHPLKERTILIKGSRDMKLESLLDDL